MQYPHDNLHFSKENIEKIFGTPFSDGNDVKLVWKDRESFIALFDAVKNAKKLICLQFYIFRDDETGIEMAEILKKKASEGVAVRLIYDHFGSIFTPRSFWKALENAGVQISVSRPFAWSNPFHYLHRDHRKLIIIDNSVAFTGGINIANEYRGYHTLKKADIWRDTGIFINGPAVRKLSEEFRKSWESWNGTPFVLPDPEVQSSVSGAGLPVLPIFTNSAKSRRRMRKLLYYSIESSSKSIYLTTAYFTPSLRMLHILETAVSRGVEVKLLLPGISDVSSAHYAGRAFFSKLLKAGIQIYTYNGVILHAKTSVFDEVWSVIGSANLDFQSLRRNDEGNVGIIDHEFGKQMAAMFFDDLTRSEKVLPEKWKSRPLSEKIKEHFFALFRRRL